MCTLHHTDVGVVAKYPPGRVLLVRFELGPMQLAGYRVTVARIDLAVHARRRGCRTRTAPRTIRTGRDAMGSRRRGMCPLPAHLRSLAPRES